MVLPNLGQGNFPTVKRDCEEVERMYPSSTQLDKDGAKFCHKVCDSGTLILLKFVVL